MDGEEEHGRDVDHLDGGHLDGVDGGDGEGRGVLVGVVKLVEALVEKRHVVDPVGPVGQVVLEGTNKKIKVQTSEPKPLTLVYSGTTARIL